MSDHGRHALAGDVIEHGDGLVRAGGGHVQSAAVHRDLDEGAVLADGALEGLGVFAVAHGVHADVAVLAGGQNVLAIVLKQQGSLLHK